MNTIMELKNNLGLSYAKLILAASSGVGRLSDQRDYYKFESESTGWDYQEDQKWWGDV